MTRLSAKKYDRFTFPATQPVRAAVGCRILLGGFLLSLAGFPVGTAVAQPEAQADVDDVLMRAMVDELNRSMKSLVLEDLPRPYFMQYRATDRRIYSLSASNGGLQKVDVRRARRFASRIRVGSMDLDNTNVGQMAGAMAALPLDDDYAALRHVIWRATDTDYKRAVEILTRKVAYLKNKTVEDRPADFSPREKTVAIEPVVKLEPDTEAWSRRVTSLSARFAKYPGIQNSWVSMYGGSENRWLVNSEGTRTRNGDSGLFVRFDAQVQADDGMYLFDSVSYLGESPADLPALEEMERDLDKLCERLLELKGSEVLDHYAGPVLFGPKAAGQVFGALLADGVCARPLPLGARRGDEQSFERRIDRRILPRFLSVYDNPVEKKFDGRLLAGSYQRDDEGVTAARVSIVENGVLKRLLASRVPTKTTTTSTGHARSEGLTDAQAHIGCLYIVSDEGMSADELKKELIEAADEEGLDFGLRVESMHDSGGGLGSPIHAYRVFVEDGREERVRGLDFLPVPTRALKRILAAGEKAELYNSISGIGSSVISPAVLSEELELTKSQEEFEKLPILKSPATRSGSD